MLLDRRLALSKVRDPTDERFEPRRGVRDQLPGFLRLNQLAALNSALGPVPAVPTTGYVGCTVRLVVRHGSSVTYAGHQMHRQGGRDGSVGKANQR